jgi:uncharacterized protein (TIGR02246 family)
VALSAFIGEFSRRAVLLFGCASLLSAGLASAQPASPTPESPESGDEAAVRAVLEAQLAAWAAGDGAAFGATVSEDSDLIAFDGAHVVGRPAIASFMQKQFDTVLADTRVAAEPARIRFINDDSAVMITEGGVIFPGESAVPAERFSIQTFVLSKQDGTWLIEAFQNTRIAPSQP